MNADDEAGRDCADEGRGGAHGAGLWRREPGQDRIAGRHRVAQAFLSGFSVPAEAERYAARAERGGVIGIIVPRGQSGAACVHAFPRYRYRQFELLLNVGTKLRILSDIGMRLVSEAFGVGDAGP
ncbi:MAG: hypothetical protein ACREFU_02260 [Acetobacteraceae bacterium]